MKHRHIERAGVFSWNKWAGVVREWVIVFVWVFQLLRTKRAEI